MALTMGAAKGAIIAFSKVRKLPGSMKSFVGRSSVTNMYISSRETGLTPTLTLSPSHMIGALTSAMRGTTARHTHCPV